MSKTYKREKTIDKIACINAKLSEKKSICLACGNDEKYCACKTIEKTLQLDYELNLYI